MLLNASLKDKESLQEIHSLLHALFVRNRHQHKRNHWFKSLQQFRKQLGLLLEEMETKKKTVAEQKVTARLRYWDDHCIHQWYL
ncbi:hypothetical protein M011DRAFT_465207 [Sporormia fimetaria CBS 119925]|uniref:RNase MRP protein 1 RNA binding domain-containing protein n=1 Tax=Sporormia fimetaria CBS 119925 TaxID=1340428 RepID=A0A6A6VKY3_9PLEO|nr:hypothetical protein M011DRAFT_465207 [Sporormia fimetaria CBS 119925]